jgi:hypothetical protein
MDSSITDVAAIQEATSLKVAKTTEKTVDKGTNEGGYALLDLVWPMPIGLLVMGTLVAAFLGICSMLR